MSGPSEWALDRAEAIAALRHADGTRYGDVIDLADALAVAREEGRRAGIEAAAKACDGRAAKHAEACAKYERDDPDRARDHSIRASACAVSALAIRSLLTTTPAEPGGEKP